MRVFILLIGGCIAWVVWGNFGESCCASSTKTGKCTGSDNCTACSNCKYCAHCKAGGTCGVCKSADKPQKPAYRPYVEHGETTKTTPSKKKTTKVYRVKSATLNLREQPYANAAILCVLKQEDVVTKIRNYDETWMEVEVQCKDGEVYKGFVYVRYLMEG